MGKPSRWWIKNIDARWDGKWFKVFLNGKWVGVHAEANELESFVRELRRRKDIESEVQFVQNEGSMSEVRSFFRTLEAFEFSKFDEI